MSMLLSCLCNGNVDCIYVGKTNHYHSVEGEEVIVHLKERVVNVDVTVMDDHAARLIVGQIVDGAVAKVHVDGVGQT